MDRRFLLTGLLAGATALTIPSAFAETRPAPTAKSPKPVAKPKAKPQIIAIDAGHGGKDPGAIGVRGTYEKDITIAVSQALARKLDGTGRYKVVMTRSDDTFIPLADRVKIARGGSAGLFLSLHADSGGNPQRRGFSVYTLAEKASDDLAGALAQRENDVDRFAGVDLRKHSRQVRSILMDLMQRETQNHSAIMAQSVVDTLQPPFTPLEKPHRQANFAVLRSPDIPSILVEMGFLSNVEDEKLLNQKATQARLVDRISAAIDGYFSTQTT